MHATHRYFFKVYALDTKLNLDSNSRKKDVEKAMKGHILAKGELVGSIAEDECMREEKNGDLRGISMPSRV